MRTTIEPNPQIRLYDLGKKIKVCNHIKITGYFERDVVKGMRPEYLEELEISCAKCKKKFKFDIRVN